MTHRGLLSSVVAALVVVACTNAQEARDSEPPVVAEQRLPTIDHVSPPRDAVGAAPRRFEWTAAKDADEYAIGVWDDVDREIWSDFHVRGTSVMLPNDVYLDFGTYYWSVTAMRAGRPIAETGRSAFVVKD